jgi:hypothetical protein
MLFADLRVQLIADFHFGKVFIQSHFAIIRKEFDLLKVLTVRSQDGSVAFGLSVGIVNVCMRIRTVFLVVPILTFGILQSFCLHAADSVPIFNGGSLNGWEGNTGNWRVENGAIVAGALDRKQPHNEFLATTREFGNFELRLQYKIEGSNGFVNGGVQFWSQRVPNNFEVSGYQADLGADTDGNLYDESRRNKNLVEVSKAVREKALKPGAWNDYRIRAEGSHIQLWLNGVKTVDYMEPDASIPRHGIIALQIHGGAYTKVQYRDFVLEELPEEK